MNQITTFISGVLISTYGDLFSFIVPICSIAIHVTNLELNAFYFILNQYFLKIQYIGFIIGVMKVTWGVQFF